MFVRVTTDARPKSTAPVGKRAASGPLSSSKDLTPYKADVGDQHDPRAELANEVLGSLGEPLPTTTRAFFEPRFGFDLSRVRIHSDEEAARSAQWVGAPAYAIGQHIIFGSGRYEPRSIGGRMLLAHELSHTIQQRDAGLPAQEGKMRRSTSKEEREAERAAASVLASHHPALTPGSQLAVACAPAGDAVVDPAEAKLHDAEQLGDAASDFRDHNSGLGVDVLSKIRAGIFKLTFESKTYEVAYSFFKFYSSFGNNIRKMSADEEAKARKFDLLAETDTTLGFTTTTLRSDTLSWDSNQLAVLLLHEFSHTGHIASSASAAGEGKYQEGQSYGLEYFYAEIAGDTARMSKIRDIVSAGEVLGYMKATYLARFQEDFKVTYALLTAFREVVTKGASPHLPFPELTSASAQLLEAQTVTSFQNPGTELAKYIAYVKANLASFSLPLI
jgi:uncharacterized protein DUF4157